MDELAEFMTTLVKWGPADPYGNATLTHTCNAWCEYHGQLVRDRDGAEILSTATVYTPVDAEVNAGDYMQIPGEEKPRRVIDVATYRAAGLPLPQHREVRLQ